MSAISPAADPKDIAIASGAILAALIDSLIAKGVLTADDAHKIMAAALNGTSARAATDGPGAAHIVATLARAYAATRNA
jgi:hypothetical protein